ncbi:MAG: aminomethyltransferase, partial [Rhodobiaceae bacterium]|nr:aminomethyltransferase [Rhodobiaceae bacterium]
MENEIIHLKDRSVISIQGEDSEKFLQSIVTCNLDLQDQNSLSGALLSPQGKLMNNFIVFKKDPKFLIDVHKSSTEEFLKKLSIYKLKSKIQIEEENELLVFVSLEKPYK